MDEFLNQDWHDAVLKEINIDRNEPGIKDVITLIIQWPNDDYSKIIFYDVYMINFNMNFGVIAEECISEVNLISKDNETFKALIERWVNIYEDILTISGYEINTLSTNSSIKIFAKSFSITPVSVSL